MILPANVRAMQASKAGAASPTVSTASTSRECSPMARLKTTATSRQRTAHGFAGECERVALLLSRAQSQVDADAHVPRPGFLHQVWSVQRLDTRVAHTHEALLQAGEFEAIVTRTKRFKRDCRHPRRASWMTFRTMTSVDLWLAVLWMGIANSCPSTFADPRHGEPDLSIYGGDQASRRSSAGWVIDQRCTISHGGSVRQTSSDRGAVRLGRPETR